MMTDMQLRTFWRNIYDTYMAEMDDIEDTCGWPVAEHWAALVLSFDHGDRLVAQVEAICFCADRDRRKLGDMLLAYGLCSTVTVYAGNQLFCGRPPVSPTDDIARGVLSLVSEGLPIAER